MTLSVMEAVKRCLGWCPASDAGHLPGNACISAPYVPPVRDEDAEVVRGIAVSFHSREIPVPVFIILVASLAVAGPYIFILSRPSGGLFAAAFLLGFGIWVLCTKGKKASLGFSGDRIAIYRTLRAPVIIPREMIAKSESGRNSLFIPGWALYIVLVVILAFFLGHVYKGLAQPAFVPLAYGCGVVLFFTALFSRISVKSSYPMVVMLTTEKGRKIEIYTRNPERIMQLLEDT